MISPKKRQLSGKTITQTVHYKNPSQFTDGILVQLGPTILQ